MLKVRQKVVVKGGFGSEKPVRVRIDAISTKNDREIIEYTDWDGQDRWAYVSQIIDFNPDDDKETMDKYAIGEIKPVEPEPVKLTPEILPVVTKFSLPKDILPLESVIEPSVKVKFPAFTIGDVKEVVIETALGKPIVTVFVPDTTASISFEVPKNLAI